MRKKLFIGFVYSLFIIVAFSGYAAAEDTISIEGEYWRIQGVKGRHSSRTS